MEWQATIRQIMYSLAHRARISVTRQGNGGLGRKSDTCGSEKLRRQDGSGDYCEERLCSQVEENVMVIQASWWMLKGYRRRESGLKEEA